MASRDLPFRLEVLHSIGPVLAAGSNYHAGEETIVRVLVELSASVDQLTAALALFLRPLHRGAKDEKVTFLRDHPPPPAPSRVGRAAGKNGHRDPRAGLGNGGTG